MEKSKKEKTKTKHDESAAGQSSSVNSTESAIGLNNPLSAARSVVGHAPSQPSTASTLAGAADKKIPASTSTQSNEDRPFLAPRPTSEHSESGHESMDSSDTDTLCGDNNSVVSEKSGCTVIGSDLGKLNLTSGFVKMKSAEKRRFKQAMASGHSREKALEIARNASTAKRVRSEESAKETPGGKKPKTSSHVGRPTFSQVASIVRLGIVPSDLAKSPFNKEQLVLIQETVIDVMIEVDDNNKPVFEGAIHRNGWLLFLCSNNDTAKWMRSNFDLIKKKCGLEMMLVEENDFPKTSIVRGFFPQSIELSNEKVLATIGVQNNLAAKHWKVIQRSTEGALLHLVMTVDDESLSRLTELKGKIAYRFGHVRLILKSNKAGVKAEESVGTAEPLGAQEVPAATSISSAVGHTDETTPKEEEEEKPSTSKAALERQNAIKVVKKATAAARHTQVPKQAKPRPVGGHKDHKNKGPRGARLQHLVAENSHK